MKVARADPFAVRNLTNLADVDACQPSLGPRFALGVSAVGLALLTHTHKINLYLLSCIPQLATRLRV
jgi:hypothetical protein